MTPKMLRSVIALASILTFTALAQAQLCDFTPVPPAQCDFYVVNILGQADSGFGPQAFGIGASISEFVVLRTPGLHSKPHEVVITNFPRGLFDIDLSADVLLNFPQVGRIELMTNSLYANNPGRRECKDDQASVSVSQLQNPGDLVQFQLIPLAALAQPQPNAAVFPGQGSLLGGLAFLPGGLSGLTDFFGGLSAGVNILQTQSLVPNQGGGFVFFPTPDRSVIQGAIQSTAIVQTLNPNIQGSYAANFQGRFLGTAECQ